MSAFTFGVNRMVAPGLPIREFIELAGKTGAAGVELRNDLPGFDVTDGESPAQVMEWVAAQDMSVLSINAVQHFNMPESLEDAKAELLRLIAIGRGLGNPAIILCPHNDTTDRRSSKQMITDTREALRRLRPLLEDSGVIGLVEPLGFPECSLRSPATAAELIQEVGGSAYRLTIDTFHFSVAGLDPVLLGESAIPVELVGLVHLSGVTATGKVELFRDPDRVYVDVRDRVQNVKIVERLIAAGYRGAFSFEPFSPEVHGYTPDRIREALMESINYLKISV